MNNHQAEVTSIFSIAIVEDDSTNVDALVRCIEKMGHVAKIYRSGEALFAADDGAADLYLIDWGLPQMQGPAVMRRLRGDMQIKAPIIFCTARTNEQDIADVLQMGADDFISKPLRMGEVKARINAVLRRTYAERAESACIDLAPYAIDLLNREIRVHGNLVDLQAREFELALMMFRHVNGVVTRERIEQEIWDGRSLANSRTLDTHMSRIRKKLALTPENGVQVQTLYGVGYRMNTIRQENMGQPAAHKEFAVAAANR